MIDGTRPYKGKSISTTASSTENSPSISAVDASKSEEISSGNATNLERREWFASLLPALGGGLVKILRESNNLKVDLHEALKQKAEEISKSETKEN
jgi:hypothetical protein